MGVYDILGLVGYYAVTFDRDSLHVVVEGLGMHKPCNAESSFVCGNVEWTLRLFVVGELSHDLVATCHSGPWVPTVQKRVICALQFT